MIRSAIPVSTRVLMSAGSAAMCLACAMPAVAQTKSDASPLTLDASIRVRGEAIDGQFRNKGPESDALVEILTTISAEYDAGFIRFGGELIDVRTYGQKSNSTVGTADDNALEPLQAWVAFDFGSALGTMSKSALTAGRFTMDLGSGRLVGRAGFPGSPNAYTGARFDWKGGAGNTLTAFWTMPDERLPTGSHAVVDHGVKLDRSTTDRQFYGAIYARPKTIGGAALELYGYRLFERDAPGYETRNRRLVTIGSRLFRKPAKNAADFEVEGAYQTGKTRASAGVADTNDIDVSAALAHAGVGWTFASAWQPRVAAVFDYATGNGRDPTSYGRFDPLFGKRRGDFGPTTLYGPISYSNLVSAGLSIEAKPAKGWDFFVKGRGLWLESATDSFASTGVKDSAGNSGTYAGTQVEARVRTWLVPKRLQLEAGGAYLAKGGFLKDAPNVQYTGDTRYGYLALTAGF